MGKTTDIQWADSSLNLMIGCDGCELAGRHCYAETLVGRYAGRKGWPEAFNKPEVFLDRLEPALRWPDLTGTKRPGKPWLDGKPRLVFLNDLGDTFTESLSLDWMGPAVEHMGPSPHRWLILTKRPHRAAAFRVAWSARHGGFWPENVWFGTSVTSQQTIGRLKGLIEIPGVGRFVSFEPLLGPIDVSKCLEATRPIGQFEAGAKPWLGYGSRVLNGNVIDWIITGGESGPSARPCDVAWILALIEAGKQAGIKTFVKQLGSCPVATPVPGYTTGLAKLRHPKGGDWSEWPAELRVREVP